jgi:hypothetical protein
MLHIHGLSTVVVSNDRAVLYSTVHQGKCSNRKGALNLAHLYLNHTLDRLNQSNFNTPTTIATLHPPQASDLAYVF